MVNNTQESTGDFDVDDVEFLSHDGKPLLARVYIPRGTGPFRSIIEVHGGAWSDFDRLRGKHVHEALAKGTAIFRCSLSGASSDRLVEVPAWMFDRSVSGYWRSMPVPP